MPTPAAVLWDMDGTLVDTEPYWISCEHALVDEFGGTWSDADAHSVVGFDLLDAAAQLRDRGGVRMDPPQIVERLLDGVQQVVHVDGLLEIVQTSRRRCSRAGRQLLPKTCGSGLSCS